MVPAMISLESEQRGMNKECEEIQKRKEQLKEKEEVYEKRWTKEEKQMVAAMINLESEQKIGATEYLAPEQPGSKDPGVRTPIRAIGNLTFESFKLSLTHR